MRRTDIKKDSPTAGRDSFRVFLAIGAAHDWKVESTDIKAAFLQGVSLEREVYIEPPKEVKTKGVIWRLKKCMYGLNDAPRKWFLKVEQTLKELRCKQYKMDPAVFSYSTDGV